MDWQEARDRSLEHWKNLHESIDDLDEVDLLREINVVHDMCEKATGEAHEDLHHCDYCVAFQQYGGCMGISLEMSEAVVEKDQERLNGLIAQYIDRLENLKIPS